MSLFFRVSVAHWASDNGLREMAVFFRLLDQNPWGNSLVSLIGCCHSLDEMSVGGTCSPRGALLSRGNNILCLTFHEEHGPNLQ